MTALVESIHSLGTHIYEIHKDACTVKEDDLSFSTFSFKLCPKSHDEALDLLIKAEKEIDKLAKADSKPNMIQRTPRLLPSGSKLWPC